MPINYILKENEAIPCSFEYCTVSDLKNGDWYVQETERFDLAHKYLDENWYLTAQSQFNVFYYADGSLPQQSHVYKITDPDYIALLELRQ